MLGWAFMGGLIVPALAVIPWLTRRLNGAHAVGLGASLLGLWYGSLFIHVSTLAWLGETRHLFAMGAVPGLLAGLSGLAATFVPWLPVMARRLLYVAAGLLLLPLLPALPIFFPGIAFTLIAVSLFWGLGYLAGRSPVGRRHSVP